MSASKDKTGLLAKLLSKTWKTIDYAEARALMRRIRPKHPNFPCFFVGWDNTARRGDKAWIILNSDPETVEAEFREIVATVVDKPDEEQIVFINAWNEWAEGMTLEPNQYDGLEVIKRIGSVIREHQGATDVVSTAPATSTP